MEPDLYVLARPPAGVQGENARDHAVGPSPRSGGGERVPRGGESRKYSRWCCETLN